MKIEQMIIRLQELQAEHPGIDVVVGRDHREVDEVPADSISFADGAEELDLEDRVVIWAVD